MKKFSQVAKIGLMTVTMGALLVPPSYAAASLPDQSTESSEVVQQTDRAQIARRSRRFRRRRRRRRLICRWVPVRRGRRRRIRFKRVCYRAFVG